jgi:hypothetical protein
MMRLLLSSVLVLGLLAPAHAQNAEPPSVKVINGSEPVLCAEKDNVTVSLVSDQVRSFSIEAAHPSYIGSIVSDRHAPDWAACDMKDTALSQPQPERITLFETMDTQLVGYRIKDFWAKSDATVSANGKSTSNIQMVQLWKRFNGRLEEILVVYPADGYWRARPFAPSKMSWTAYGSSFLLGPIEVKDRPFVSVKDIAFDDATSSFNLTFVNGNKANVKIAKADDEAVKLDVAFDKPITGGAFATLRSMYITEFNADSARIALREKGKHGWTEGNVMSFKDTEASEVWVGRLVPSRHNTSAPDFTLGPFRTDAKPASKP